jgi:hypothetical protein
VELCLPTLCAEVHGHLDFFLATMLAFALVRLGAMHFK